MSDNNNNNNNTMLPGYTRLDTLPPELLRRIFGYNAPKYDLSHRFTWPVHWYAPANPECWTVLAIARDATWLSRSVQQAAVETWYEHIVAHSDDDLMDLIDSFDRVPLTGRCVRKATIPGANLNRAGSGLYGGDVNSSSEEEEDGQAYHPDEVEFRNMIDISDLDYDRTVEVGHGALARLQTPLVRILRRYWRHLVLAQHMDPTAKWNMATPWAVSAVRLMRFLARTPGITEITSVMHGFGLIPFLDGLPNNTFHFPKLTSLTLDESNVTHFGDPNAPLCFDISGFVVRSAPNLQTLTLAGFAKLVMETEHDPRVFAAGSAETEDIIVGLTCTPAHLKYLRRINLYQCTFSQASIEQLVRIIGPDYFASFHTNMVALGTVDRILERKPIMNSYESEGSEEDEEPENADDDQDDDDNDDEDDSSEEAPIDGYHELVATCYGVVQALLPWRETLKSLTLQLYPGDYNNTINLHFKRRSQPLKLGTSLLPHFTALEDLVVDYALFNSLFFKIPKTSTDWLGDGFEFHLDADDRFLHSIAGNLPASIKTLVLSKFYGTPELVLACEDPRPLVGLLQALQKGLFPDLTSITIENAHRPSETVLFPINVRDGVQRHVTLNCANARDTMLSVLSGDLTLAEAA
ncbi:hypothetical protein SEUCBS140593_005853 [Sporothrix eucalyptigena]|uniref:F-box domain-containing protein n=1 Tax=Sporothrix eucalyptigena TaxID=1812306 RepID=A0ABP0C0E5_9PEZI